MLYVKTSNQPALVRIAGRSIGRRDPRAKEVDAEFVGDSGGNTTFSPTTAARSRRHRPPAGAAAVKPPYGEFVAINLVRGEIAWRVPFGIRRPLRSHPLLKDVKLPDRLGVAGRARGHRDEAAGWCLAAVATRRSMRSTSRPAVSCGAGAAAADVGDADDLPGHQRPGVHRHRHRVGANASLVALALK